MFVCQMIVAVVGVTVGFNKTTIDAAGEPIARNISAVNAQVAFIALSIFFFASTWGPGGESSVSAAAERKSTALADSELPHQPGS